MPETSSSQGTIAAPVVVTAHANADFDALASIVAAGKLYPGATLLFPGSQERTLRHFFIKSATYLFNFKQAKEIDVNSVKTLVIVDTRQYSRVPHVHAILERPEVQVHLYDHHPETEEDIKGTYCQVQNWGATASILTHEIMRTGASLTTDEATILGLGIFEDTGSFTFASTTEHDFVAAGWLKKQGMDLNTISELLTRDLTSEQIGILNELLESAHTHDINGIPVVIAEASMDAYMGDFALLAHKLMDMENIQVLFTLGRMEDRVQVVARSRISDVNVGEICTELGGGGHSYAASASVKFKTLSQVKDELFSLLYSAVNKQLSVGALMSSPVISEDETASIAKVAETMQRFGLKAIPIMHPGTAVCSGYIEYQTATRATAHGLGEVPVTDYMNRELSTATPDDSLHTLMETIVGQRQRIVPVTDVNGNAIGVVTRTDLINTIIEEPARIPETLQPEKKRERNIQTIVREKLPRQHVAWLELAGRLGDAMGVSVYIVGGFVRDLMLGRPNLDLDIVVEGEGIAFAKRLAEELNGRVREHQKFKTAVVIFEDESGKESRIDVATARLEYYEYPAALPTVELSSIKMDLFRRDFTINALAVQLNSEGFGRLVDFFGSQQDIKDKRIRVLHSLSFVEDPTRILRAIRFEKRYNFVIGPQTSRLIKNALGLGLIEKLSGSRLFHELQLIMNEASPLACFKRMEEFDLLRAAHPVLALSYGKEQIIEDLEKVLGWHRLLYQDPPAEAWIALLLGLCHNAKYAEVSDLLGRLYLPRKQAKDFLMLRENSREAAALLSTWLRKDRSMSGLYNILHSLPVEGLLYIMARTKIEEIRKFVSHYLTKLRDIEPDITGEDLQVLGGTPSPCFGVVLNEILAAKLDGIVTNRKDQLEMAYELLGKYNFGKDWHLPSST
ncbi:CBS domain-containing protein [Oleidesulfovibrio sp.]|uniref:CBS domain-containing protein n=1 Tax=Oleidesulfovibrio sp. TaxID=2909707 RepID=UPI003A860CCA